MTRLAVMSFIAATWLQGACMAREPFAIFDATVYLSKSASLSANSEPILVLDQHLWKDANQQALPNKVAVVQAVQRSPAPRYVVLDFEQWPVKGAGVEDTIRKFSTVIQWVREAAPEAKIGIYGVLPVQDYWRAVRPDGDKERLAWNAEAVRLAPLGESVDALFPSLYTFYENSKGWTRYAIAQIQMARTLAPGKPVYPFIWPEFHDSSPLKGRFLPSALWREELMVLCKYTDGVVIWGGWNYDSNSNRTWSDSAEWWQDLVEFRKVSSSNCGR